VVHPGGDVKTRAVAAIDPDAKVTRIDGDDRSARVVIAGSDALGAWEAAVTAGRRAMSYQLLGGVGMMIDLAVTHARTRVQFGRPVGTFQAVRHRLADAHVALQGAEAAGDISWEADDPGLAAMLAKSLAGRAAKLSARHCQQVLAGTGFTAEHPLHRYLYRALLLDRLLGSSTELPQQIGAHLVAAHEVPRLVQL
jgi:alkylation response protein AidB-like acyl-CoA dehydrogenase